MVKLSLNPLYKIVTKLILAKVVRSLSHKFLYVSQVTKDLNCIVLMYLSFCLLQNILTEEIIWHGTKWEDSTI